MNNPYTNELMKKRKPRNRFTLTPKHDADMGRLLTTLKQGSVLALLIDQHARKGGMMIDFFGIPASTHTSHAMLHLITKTPMCFGYCVKTGPMKFKFKALPPIDITKTGKRDDDVKAILAALTKELEDAIRAYPEQYLWAHRRWR
jgi:KDO2-lipid IV(A) lauroyltransferase